MFSRDNRRPILLVVLIAVVFITIVFCVVVNAASLTYSTAQTISLSSPATNLTIATGSLADIVQVNTTSVIVTLSSSTGGSFTLLSPSYDLSVATSSGGGTITTSCTQGVVSSTITQTSGLTVYTITPVGTTCSGSGPAVISSFSANPTSIASGASSILSWTVSNSSSTTLDHGIGDVTNQTSTSVIPSQTTTYTLTAVSGSGSSTTAQATITVTPAPAGDGGSSGSGGGGGGGGGYINFFPTIESSTGTGTVVTLQAQLNSLLLQLQKLEQQSQTSVSHSNVVIPLFRTDLQLRDSGPAVRYLQEFLAQNNTIYPNGTVTGYFGSLTLRAVQRFQTKYSIASSRNPAYGYVGPITRAKLNALIQKGLSP